MQVRRFYLPPSQCRGDTLRLDGREAHHALRALRLERGDEAAVLDGTGNELFCEVKSTERDSVSLHVRKKTIVPPPPCFITLFVGIPRGKIIEDIIQKSVELGARRVAPLLTERVVTRLSADDAEHKREQWQQVAIEAMKQCGAAWLPEVSAPATIETLLSRPDKIDLHLVGSLQKVRRHPHEVFGEYESANSRKPRTVGVWIGPEGDFTPDELKMIENAGAKPVSLGGLVLRVETAAIYCLSVLNYEFNSIEKQI